MGMESVSRKLKFLVVRSTDMKVLKAMVTSIDNT